MSRTTRRTFALRSGATLLVAALAWGLGWGLERAEGRDYFRRWGDNGTFHCFAIGDPIRRNGLAIFTNSNFGPKLYQRLVNHATGHDHPAFLWI